MKKTSSLAVILGLVIVLLAGCAPSPTAPAATTPAATAPAATGAATAAPTSTTVDTVTSASIVNANDTFEKAIGPSGTWIICLLNDLTFDKELKLDGDFKNGKKDTAGNELLQRKIALYSQDAQRNVTARYTLTCPKLTINSANASLQHGMFIGDLYVMVPNFQLVDQKVTGNIYFADVNSKSTFKMDDKSSVSGVQEVKAQ